MAKTDSGISIGQFLEKYDKRLNWFILRFIRQYRLDRELFDDLRQTAIVSLLGTLPYYSSSGGRNAFNFVAPALLKAFRRECKQTLRKRVVLEDGQKLEQSFGVGQNVDFAQNMAVAIDLRRTLENDPKPAQVVRFIAHALSPASGGDLARLDGLSRQAFYARRKLVRARLISNLR